MAMKSIFMLIMLICLSSAQEVKILTLDDCIRIALERNIEIRRARYAVETSSSNVLSAYGVFLPSLNITGNWSRLQKETPFTFIPGLGLVPIPTLETYNSFSTSVSTNILLFNGFANIANLNRAKSNYLSADYSFRRTRQTVIFQTHQLYLNVLRTKQLLKVSQDNLKRSRGQLERIREANRVGSVSLADVYRQEVQVGSDELALIRAQNDYEKAKTDLIAYLGLDPSIDYEFEDPSIGVDTMEFIDIREWISNLQALISEAFENRPDYKSAIFNLNASRSGVTSAYSGYMPTISAFASYRLDSDQIRTLTDNRTLGWGINISFPIFDRFQLQTRIQQAKIDVKNAEVQIEQVKRQINSDIRKAVLDLESAMKQLEVAERQVKSAELDLKTAEEKYNVGSGTLLDLLVATANYTQALSSRVNAIYDYIIAKTQLRYALGTLDVD